MATNLAVNCSKEARELLKKKAKQVIEPSAGQYIAISDKLTWRQTEALAGQRADEDEEFTEETFSFEGHPKDVICTVSAFFGEFFGTISWGPTQKFVVDAYGKEQSVPADKFPLPAPFRLECYMDWATGKITFKFQNMYRDNIEALVARMREYLKENSIYKGKALIIKKGNLGFWQTDGPVYLVLPEHLKHALQTRILVKIAKRDKILERGESIKTSLTMDGSYGNGKTQIAKYLAQQSVKHGVTFLYVETPEDYEQVIPLINYYPDIVIFMEDVDRLVRDVKDDKLVADRVDSICNWLDAVNTKSSRFICIFSTNHIDLCEAKMPKFMRPDRGGNMLLHVPNPAPSERLKLFEVYLGETTGHPGVEGGLTEENLQEFIDDTNGMSCAQIVECCKQLWDEAIYFEYPLDQPYSRKSLASAVKCQRDTLARRIGLKDKTEAISLDKYFGDIVKKNTPSANINPCDIADRVTSEVVDAVDTRIYHRVDSAKEDIIEVIVDRT